MSGFIEGENRYQVTRTSADGAEDSTGADGRTRTGTALATAPSRQRVYLFHHIGMQSPLVPRFGSRVLTKSITAHTEALPALMLSDRPSDWNGGRRQIGSARQSIHPERCLEFENSTHEFFEALLNYFGISGMSDDSISAGAGASAGVETPP